MLKNGYVNVLPYCGCMLFVLCSGANARGDSIEALVAQNEPVVLVIEGVRADGSSTQSSGCVVHRDGLVLTTAHQVSDVETLTARQSDGTTFSLSVLETDKERELALLRASQPLSVAARLGDANTLRTGATLVTIATPVNLDFSVASGIVANANRSYRGFPVIQAELTAAPGSSGGPVFNVSGEVVGVIMGVLEEQGWATIVIPINNAYSMLERYGAYQTRLPTDTREQELMPVADISQVESRALEAYNNGTRAANAETKKIYYRRAVELLPEFYEAWFNLGVAASNANSGQTATQAYQRALALRPESIEARRNLGRLYMEGDAYNDAATIFEEVVRLLPDAPQTYNDLGEAYRNAGAREAAIEMYKQAISLDAFYTNALYNLAITYVQESDWEQAYDAFERYLAAAPDAADRLRVENWMDAIREQLSQ